MRRLKAVFFVLLTLSILTTGFGYWYLARQGRDSVDWSRVPGVEFDADGIPTITGGEWEQILEKQGFVVASDRLWQMDLMRRSGGGTLSEWFGSKALSWDEKRRAEDWIGTAERAVQALPANERLYCDSYALGVNRFIEERPNYWGAEYLFLGEKPAPWSCRDSILILLSMAEDLSSSVDEEAAASVWRQFLPPAWEQFFFSQEHPWNKPIFSKTLAPSRDNAPRVAIKRAPIGKDEVKEPSVLDSFFPGSNAWVYRGSEGVFLANDPHLATSVPQLWYPIRLKRSTDEWVVGVALPGMGGTVLGRNANIAWGFTNAGEDVDDLLEEELSKDGKKYVASRKGGVKVWKEIESRPYVIRVRGAADKKGEARFTHRGPLSERKHLPGKQYSRQWLPLKAGMLRLPIVDIMTSKNWEQFNLALDSFSSPAQAILFAQKDGGIGMRVSGRGVQRRCSGLAPQNALEGEWLGIEPPSLRPRLFYPASDEPKYLSTANQRLWTHGWGEHWASDLRQDRIQRAIEAENPMTIESNQRLQLDTQSRFHQHLLGWIARHATPNDDRQKRLLQRFAQWDGVAAKEESLFAQALYAEGMLSALALSRVRKAYLPATLLGLDYKWYLHNAWELALVTESKTDPWNAFGLDSHEVAQWILDHLVNRSKTLTGYSQANRWRSQHPFARAVPYFGWFFSVDAHSQSGFDGLVRVERPYAGASGRLIWDMKSREAGLWSFPVGPSGHFLSRFYTSFRARWFEGGYLPVIP